VYFCAIKKNRVAKEPRPAITNCSYNPKRRTAKLVLTCRGFLSITREWKGYTRTFAGKNGGNY